MADLLVYQGMEYGQDFHSRWFFVLPSGLRAYPPKAKSEADIKLAIDGLIGDAKL